MPHRYANGFAMAQWLNPALVGDCIANGIAGDALMGQYTALIPDKKVMVTLRSDAPGDYSTCTVAIAEKAGVSTITLTDSSDSKDWAKLASEIEAGWNESLDNLKSVLETGVDQRIARRPMLGIYEGEAKPNDEGVRLDGVAENMPAAEAGLQKGDVLLKLKRHQDTQMGYRRKPSE